MQAGDFAAVTRAGDVFRLNPTALDFEEAEQRLADVQSRMPSVVEARHVNEVGREQDAELWAQRRAENMLAYALHSENRDAEQDIRRTDAEVTGAVHSAADTIEQTVDRGSGIARRALDVAAASLVESIFAFLVPAPKLTRDQAERAERADESGPRPAPILPHTSTTKPPAPAPAKHQE